MKIDFFMSRAFLSTATAIVATGAILNMANKGVFGNAAKNFANYVTSGYGAGSL